MDLILWRHAEAEDEREGGNDLERALTPRGVSGRSMSASPSRSSSASAWRQKIRSMNVPPRPRAGRHSGS